MSFTVIVYENSHYMDESESYTHGEFGSAGEALAAAKKLVDRELDSLYTPGMPPEDLYRQFTTFGVDPIIIPAPEGGFSAWDYAKERCLELCAPPGEESSKGVYIPWFKVLFDEAEIHLDVAAPSYEPWQARLEWQRIIRICFKTADLAGSDEMYIFTDERPESRVVPVDADGGYELWQEVLRRGLFDAELAIKAARSLGGELFCHPGE